MELREVIDIASAASGGREVSVDVVRATVRATDVAALAQVVTELVENAANASASQGTIEISAEDGDEGFTLSVRDHGHGVPGELLRLINAALSEPSSIPESVASGLSNVARLARKHGMRVQLTSSTAGTTAAVVLGPGIVQALPEPMPAAHTDETPTFDNDVGEENWGEATTVSALPSDEAIDMTWPTTPALTYTDEEAVAVEEFLAEVFGQLTEDTAPPVNAMDLEPSPVAATVSELRVRVPGTSFSDDPHDEIHSTSADGANEIRFALTSYDIGRDAARREAGNDDSSD